MKTRRAKEFKETKRTFPCLMIGKNTDRIYMFTSKTESFAMTKYLDSDVGAWNMASIQDCNNYTGEITLSND